MRMYISGPAGCGKSYLIGQTILEYVRHYPYRSIYLFSQVNEDLVLDKFINQAADLGYDIDQFFRVDLSELVPNMDIDIFRGESEVYEGKRPGSLCIFDDIENTRQRT